MAGPEVIRDSSGHVDYGAMALQAIAAAQEPKGLSQSSPGRSQPPVSAEAIAIVAARGNAAPTNTKIEVGGDGVARTAQTVNLKTDETRATPDIVVTRPTQTPENATTVVLEAKPQGDVRVARVDTPEESTRPGTQVAYEPGTAPAEAVAARPDATSAARARPVAARPAAAPHTHAAAAPEPKPPTREQMIAEIQAAAQSPEGGALCARLADPSIPDQAVAKIHGWVCDDPNPSSAVAFCHDALDSNYPETQMASARTAAPQATPAAAAPAGTKGALGGFFARAAEKVADALGFDKSGEQIRAPGAEVARTEPPNAGISGYNAIMSMA